MHVGAARSLPLQGGEFLTTATPTEFWSRDRSAREIETFVAAVLGRHVEVEVLSASPPLVFMRDFLSPEECAAIMGAAEAAGLKASTVGLAQKMDGWRSSETTWLDGATKGGAAAACLALVSRVAQLTGLPASHQENIQCSRYGPGGRFDPHTDHLIEFNSFPARGRLATVLCYLNGLAEEGGFAGGETAFPALNVTVAPSRGAALLFWNTVERPGHTGFSPLAPLHADPRLLHAGLEVTRGTKWACNAWVHPVPQERRGA